jgi:hypothetical protein
MQQKQEESLRDIQIKLYDMSKIKDDLKAKDEFQPNKYPFNSKETSLFGSIKLNEFSNTNPFKSEILKDEKQSFELIILCEFLPSDSWSLLYRGTREGFDSYDFHSKCGGHSNTLTILKAKASYFIFSGFTTAKWDGSEIFNLDPKHVSNLIRSTYRLKIKV